MIYNPVIRGFNPDPSICFDGKRYFIVTSTFEYFPSCAIYESSDLSSWTFHSYAMRKRELLDLVECNNSSGTWAATIRYNRGRYYVITTNKKYGDNFIVWTDDIDSGDWKGPFVVRHGGIDPSLYFEDDWCFYTSNGVVDEVRGILGGKVNPDTGELLEPVRILTEGITQHATEAPHVFKRGDWYYLIVAEGGTGTGHHENILRSRSVYGPYEENPRNPILGHIKRKGHFLQCLGHADLIDTGNDRWIAVFLGVRMPNRALNYNLGRETFIAEVTWGEDGWPMIGNGGFIDEEMPSVFLSNEKPSVFQTLDFNAPLERQNIEALRLWEDERYSQDLEKGTITVHGREAIDTPLASPSLFLIRQEEFEEDFSITLHTDSSLTGKGGITAWLTNRYNLTIRVWRESDASLCWQVKRNVHDLSVVVADGKMAPRDKVILSIRADREAYHAIINGKECASAAQVNFASNCTETMNFTGTMLGFFAEGGDATFSRVGGLSYVEGNDQGTCW